jgi:arabinofuranosyltransferase
LVWIVSNCIPWIHFGVSQEHTEWTRSMPQYPIAQELPTVLQPLGERYDELQQWLFRHGVGMRHQHHKLFSEHQSRNLPSREVADSLVEGEENALVVVTSAGIAGWRFRRAHAIDIFGLNDYVVARTPPKTAESARVVAHARQPPEGYVNAFRTNMIVTPSRISPFRKRKVPLEDAEIREIESRFRAALPEDRNTPMSER